MVGEGLIEESCLLEHLSREIAPTAEVHRSAQQKLERREPQAADDAPLQEGEEHLEIELRFVDARPAVVANCEHNEGDDHGNCGHHAELESREFYRRFQIYVVWEAPYGGPVVERQDTIETFTNILRFSLVLLRTAGAVVEVREANAKVFLHQRLDDSLETVAREYVSDDGRLMLPYLVSFRRARFLSTYSGSAMASRTAE